MNQPVLYIIVPCYNEEKVLPITSCLFRDKLIQLEEQGKIASGSRVLMVDDGSRDQTWPIISQLAADDERFTGIRQSRNRGHQNAVLAGLMEARDKCDITISIDCDGQDDINAIDAMVDAYAQGSEIVYGVRASRETDSAFKRFTAESFYKLLNWMGAEVVFNHADYRLISSRALAAFADFKEVNLYLRGLIPLVGFKSTSVFYERHERLAGESHYPLSKMISLAFEGITSLSVKPIRFIVVLGVLLIAIGLLGLIGTGIAALFGAAAAGWRVVAWLICLIGGVQTLCIGVVGEYVGKNYLETKARPRYIISERTDESKEIW